MTLRAAPSLRSQDLVFTLFGDYLLERDRPVWTAGLITLLGQLGLSPMAVRTVLSRMARKGWLTTEKRGTRSWYGLTPKGQTLLQKGRERIYHPATDAHWDGDWSLIIFSIPETRRRLRDALRVRLSWLGCGSLTSGVWISPHDVHAELLDIATELNIGQHLEVFRGAHLAHASPERLVAQCWDLAGLDRRYADFVARWQGQFGHCSQCGMTGAPAGVHSPCTSPADCFRRRFLLVHEYRAFALEDPYLPKPLLPAGWHGEAAARLFESYHDVLAGPAERYVAEVCAEGDEIVAAA
jgi:phenylacetic acid degradation operon negative regulatory protein